MYSFGTDEYTERIVTTYSSALLRAAYTVLRSTADAEDAVQDTFVKLMTKRPSFRDETHERAWLLRVVINTARDMLRSSAAHTEPIGDDFSADGNENGDPQENTEASDVLNAVLALPARYRTVIHLYYYEGCSIKDIAGILNIPAATVGTRLARARALLKDKLKGDYGDEIQ